MSMFIIIIFVMLGIGIFLFQRASHENKIYSEIESLGGKVISIESRSFSTGPFLFAGKGRTVYRIEYQLGDEVLEGWVKFGGLFGPDWRL